jgi:hypothetical protein
MGTEENFAGTGGSMSNSSGSKGVLYKPNLQINVRLTSLKLQKY